MLIDVNADTGAAWGPILLDADLKLDFSFLCSFWGLMPWEIRYECRQNVVCAGHGICSMDDVRTRKLLDATE